MSKVNMFHVIGDRLELLLSVLVPVFFLNTCACGTFQPFPFVHIVLRRVLLWLLILLLVLAARIYTLVRPPIM